MVHAVLAWTAFRGATSNTRYLLHQREPRLTTAYWKPNYKDCKGIYRNIDEN